jgi:hypothetical protein
MIQAKQQAQSTEQQELASVTGGLGRPLMSVKVEDSAGNKGEAG